MYLHCDWGRNSFFILIPTLFFSRPIFVSDCSFITNRCISGEERGVSSHEVCWFPLIYIEPDWARAYQFGQSYTSEHELCSSLNVILVNVHCLYTVSLYVEILCVWGRSLRKKFEEEASPSQLRIIIIDVENIYKAFLNGVSTKYYHAYGRSLNEFR